MVDNFKDCKESFEKSGEPKANIDILKIVFVTEALSNQTMQGLYEMACAGLIAKYKPYSHEEMVDEISRLGYDELLDSYLRASLERGENRLRLLQWKGVVAP